jgi:hypothetical protein
VGQHLDEVVAGAVGILAGWHVVAGWHLLEHIEAKLVETVGSVVSSLSGW